MATKKGSAQRNWIAFGAISVVAVATAAYEAIEVGAVTASSLLIAMVTATLALSLFWMYRSVAVLFDNSPTNDEVAKVDGRIRRDLLREKRMLLKALAELELDYDMGKLSERDYREASVNYRARLAKLFRQLDAGADYDAFVAEELKRRRRTTPAPKDVVDADAAKPAAAEAAIAPTATPDKKPCTKCATQNDPDAEFCKKCGTALS